MDYLDFYGFDEPPFRLSPDPDFFFQTSPHLAAREVLAYGIQRKDGFMVLMGGAGTGKSLLLRILIQDLPPDIQTAVIVTPALDPQSLLEILLDELEIPLDDNNRHLGALIKKFENALLALARQNQRLLLIIDEAQNLPLETLEQLRLLSNIETNSEKLIQILLAGQPELEDLLGSPRLFQLSQRISITEELRPLTRKETGQYINFRISRAGRTDITLTTMALFRVHSTTTGIPRLINRIMDRALLQAASEESNLVTTSHIVQANKTLPDFNRHRKTSNRLPVNPALLGVTAILVLFLLLYKFYPFSGTMFQPFGSIRFMRPVQPQNISSSEPLSEKKPAQNGHDSISLVRIVVDKALIRQAPGTKHPLVTSGVRGQEFELVDERNGWFAIRIFDPTGQQMTGWIKGDLVTRIQKETTQTAIAATTKQ
ncbi:AAA family ATPase [Desulfolithobacter sp.]